MRSTDDEEVTVHHITTIAQTLTCLCCEPACELTQADDVVAVVVQVRWQQHARQLVRLGFCQKQKVILGHRGVDRRILLLPVRYQLRKTSAAIRRLAEISLHPIRALPIGRFVE